MSARSPERQVDEAEAFLSSHPDLQAIDCLLSDISGSLRGKRLPREKIVSVFRDGLRLPGSVFALDVTGETVDASGLIWEEGDADRICRPVAGTLAPCTWLDPPVGQVLLTMHEENGEPFHADPRQALDHILDLYRARGWTPVMAGELEFYLTDRVRSADGRPRPPLLPGQAERESEVQVYDMRRVDAYNALISDLYAVCREQGLPVEATIAEYAPGQMEVNLTHVADALQAADQAILLKRAIKGVAPCHGYDATFMAKPFADGAGSGAHVHFSLLDPNGRNLFDDGTEEGSDMLRHAIGGLAATMVEGMLLFAPNANSYRRFQEKSYAPMAPTWGYNNRTVALRIPSGPLEARRIEHRVAGADANSHLLMATILAGALHGIDTRIDPGEPRTGNAYESQVPALPTSWAEAIRRFEGARILPDLLGREFCEVYLVCKKQEYDKFNAHVTRRELDWYFHAV